MKRPNVSPIHTKLNRRQMRKDFWLDLGNRYGALIVMGLCAAGIALILSFYR